MFTLSRKTAVAALAIAALALTACTGPGDAGDPTDPPAGDGIGTGIYGGQTLALSEPSQGGEFTFGLSFAVPHLDPAQGIGGSIELSLIAIYDRLLEVLPDGSVGAGLAESATTDDNVVWTLELPSGVTFSDGTPFDAEAVIAHVERVADPDSTSLSAADARTIVSAVAVDPQTVEFTLDAPNSQFDLLLATGSLALVPSPTAVEEHGDRFGLNPVGAGPFVVDSFTPDGEIVLSRNENYRISGKPYVDTLRLVPVLDTQSRIAGILSGDLDGGSVNDLTDLQEAEAQGLVGLVQPSYQQYVIQPNINNEFLSDIRIRTAISHALDRDAINQVVFNGLHEPARGLLAPSHPYFQDTDWPLYDPERATELVEEYKAETGATEIRFVLLVNQEPVSSAIAALLQQQLAEVGITMVPEVVDPTTQISNVIAGTFDALTMPRAFPAETTKILSQAFGATFLNFGSGTDPDFDVLIDELATVSSDAERRALIPRMLPVLTEWVPMVPIIESAIGRIIGPDVLGFPDGDPNATSSEVFDVREVWVRH